MCKAKKTNYLLFSLAIVLTKFASMGDFAIYPITNEFYTLFPGQEALVNYIISGPQLLIMVMAFLVPLMARKFSKKQMIVLASAAFGLGSLLSVVIPNAVVIALGRTLVGVSQGILGVAAVTIVSDVFLDPDRQARYVGIYNAGGNAAAMLLSLGAGALAEYGWQKPFLLYLIAVPMVLSAVFFLPETEDRTGRTTAGQTREFTSLPLEFWMITLAGGVFSMLRTIVMYYMSSYAAENNLGGSGAAAAAASMAQLFAFVGAMSFTLVYSRIRRWIMPLACGVMAAAFILWCLTSGAATVYAVYCLACGSSGLFMSYCYAHTLSIVPAGRVNTATAILSAACGVAAFVPTYLITALMKCCGVSAVTPVLVIPMWIGILLSAGCLVYTLHLYRKKAPVIPS